MNNEERRLADLLHQITPEPARPVTVEQVAYRLVSEPRLGLQARGRQARGRQARGRQPRGRQARARRSRAWAPALAAAAVVAVAGASAGLAVLANSHHTPPASSGAAPASSVSSSSATPTRTAAPATTIGGLPWGAALIDHLDLVQGTLVSADGSLYAIGNNSTLDRIDPATGAVVASAPANMAAWNVPVVVGNTVWMVASDNGGSVVLQGYNARTLARTSSLPVPAIGGVSTGGQGVLTAGPDGNLYVAAGETIAVVNPATGQEVHRVQVLAGRASSVAVSPDGSKLYVGINASASFRLVVFDLSSDTIINESTSSGGGGNLVATSGGVWGTTGSGHSEWVWFAPSGNLGHAVRVGQGAGGGWSAYPSYSGGVVWIGGSGDLVCASPVTGQVLAKADIPSDQGGVARYLASPVVANGQAYSYYQTDASQQTGLARVTPPAACPGSVSS